MNWEQLLSLKRYGDTVERPRAQQDELRLGFDVDYDRVIFSPYFRSLQDKTQVIPLSQTGFVHTRLTHSLEVSVVGRSLGRMAGKRLLNKYPSLVEKGYKLQDFGAIVAAGALAHDIGNPPFGHSGEKAIGSFFSSPRGSLLLGSLSRKQQHDLLSFEGNANGYRLLNLSSPGTAGGLRLSYATLGAFIKYPKESLPIRPTRHISQKKFGIFQSDVKHFKDVAADMGLENSSNTGEAYNRHPLTYLVEAADDICYTIIDFEDGINLGWISEDHALEQLLNLVRDTMRTEIYTSLSSTSERLSYLRSLAINTLINDCVDIFMENEDAILEGTFSTSLIDKSQFKPQIEDILGITVSQVYRSQEVLDKEIGGYKIIQDILEAVVNASLNDLNGTASSYDQLILRSCYDLRTTGTTIYERLLESCGYVASLTDSRSLKLFHILNGKLS
ncbi:MAG: dNTP triphosphohydrolase [Nonlabens sp.]